MTQNTRNQSTQRLISILTLVATITLTACASTDTSRDTRAGTFLNPPKLGDVITARVGSVVCLNELDALSMTRTGFFTQSCSIITPDMKLVAEAIEMVDAGEGMVIMVQTTFEGQTAWAPIPWHDWV